MNPKVLETLIPAYGPCTHFKNACECMQWAPEIGHVPRGFCGAMGNLEEVELVLVFSEPGDPYIREIHQGIDTAADYVLDCFERGRDLFHRNVRRILNMCFPNLSFYEQLRRSWLTESVLCSAKKECGHIPTSAAKACGITFLARQIALFRNPLVVALGKKAHNRLDAANIIHRSAFAAAPPGCNQHGAIESWEQVAQHFRNRHSTMSSNKPAE